MARPAPPDDVKFLCGMLSGTAELFEEALGPLTEVLGPIEGVSETWDFVWTHYYDAEMGPNLLRRFVSFARPASPEQLADAKCATNAIEADLARRHPSAAARPINLDVGYVTLAKLVLASMKNFAHRIYLGRGVYAEITLQYRKGRWESLHWTFPDYASGTYDAFLTEVRDRLGHREKA